MSDAIKASGADPAFSGWRGCIEHKKLPSPSLFLEEGLKTPLLVFWGAL